MSTVANAPAEARPVAGSGTILEEARRVLRMEAEAVAALGPRLGDGFLRAVDLICSRDGMVVLSGVGKSGLIARKIAATLTSTGTPAVFLHPVDGLHGDVGIASPGNVLVLLSRSGATEELNGLLAFAELRGMPVVALVGDTGSPLARQAAAVLDCGVAVEACPMDLAPTSSTTATLAMGDALAVALLRRRGFRAADFARLHPGGSLGRRLTLRVRDVMVAEDYPAVRGEATVRDVIVPLARMRGTVPVIDDANALVGVVTAGDVARLMEHAEDFLGLAVSTFMTRTPRTAGPDELGAAAVRRMEEHGVMALPVVGDTGLEGIVHLHDLLRAGVV
ncbi:MAG: KpsF/GutQ family sugar-phosphate isomerase [Gemmatimonadetes bacterium]|nr:KpsF/GutQ family sugar-phosphate isomerase [Gemmatimonadota bacterium]MYD14595.1 KpsF/GutQ family sugar-phosphate isomerase [Gemmatimonadota bacterium]MYI67104.1 KpsF/GutQ family sugar-phosphate isomerase [Gemmatimonadota bacterium]